MARWIPEILGYPFIWWGEVILLTPPPLSYVFF